MAEPAKKPQPRTVEDERKRDLAMIHCAKKELGLDDDLYRQVLKQVCGVDSSAALDAPGRRMLLAYFRGKGWGKRKFAGRPNNLGLDDGRGKTLRRIEAMLAEAQRPWSYADTMAKHMFKVDRIAWCSIEQLNKIAIAMLIDAKRHGRKTG
ncbi:MAG TPA: regulatory protein GemA [Candidatus Ozemobacteraceae bacterium]|nr:regulatory protein GemA [Candidatus Ozemobacteraceae bacterium]